MPGTSERPFMIWLAGVLLSFAVLEEAAYRRQRHATLSRCLEHWLGCRTPRRYLGPSLFVAAWAVLVVHVLALEERPCH